MEVPVGNRPYKGGGMEAATGRWAMDGPSAGPGPGRHAQEKSGNRGALFFGSFLLGAQKK